MLLRMRATGQVMYDNEFRTAHPNTSFPPVLTVEILNDFGADPVLQGPQAQPTRYQVSYSDGVEEINGQWFTKYSVADMDEEAKKSVDDRQADSVRTERNKKLADSDWTQVADSPVDKDAWAVYRQALRDITAQEGFPWEVVWPEIGV